MIIRIAKKIRDYFGGASLGRIIEKKYFQKAQHSYPPIFILGLPRSGTTLLYQLIVTKFKTCYFSNIASVFYSFPVSISYISKPFQKFESTKRFESNYGVTKGLFAPSEAGGIYRYWNNHQPDGKSDFFQNTISNISKEYNCPFVWKNLNLSLQITYLQKIFPNALFIKIDRNLEFVIQSIYEKIKMGDSIDVAGFESIYLNENLIENITREALILDSKINKELECDQVNSITIQYDMLFDDLNNVLAKIEAAYALSGFRLIKRNSTNVSILETRNEIKLSSDEWNQILKSLMQIDK